MLGDTAFGESYQDKRAERGRPNILHEHGYNHGFEHVRTLLADVDLAVANLETPLTDRRESPFQGIRPYLHYGDPGLTIQHLLKHNIQAVTLANNHTHDFGVPGLLDTLSALETNGVLTAGAGRDLNAARRPLRVQADLLDPDQPRRPHPFRLSMFSVFRGGRQFRDVLKAYATADQPGSASLSISALSRRINSIREQYPDEFIVVAPHWRRDYQWRSERQADSARELISAGADLIVGHGSHMLQEIELIGGRWVFHGIGNFLFNSPGRYAKLGVHPYSLMARLSVTHDQRTLRLYPIVTDNRRTGYQPRPVDSAQFGEIHTLLIGQTNAQEAFRSSFWAAEDEHGHHLAAHLPAPGAPPLGSASGAEQASPADPEPNLSAPHTVRIDSTRDISTQLIAGELQQRGFDVQWLARNYIMADADGIRLGYIATDSHATGAAGVRAAKRKDLTRKLLTDAGLTIARGAAFDPENGRAEAAQLAADLTQVVVKPVDGNMGRGVTVGVTGPAEFDRAWNSAAGNTRRGVLVEEQFMGTEGRFLVVGERCIAAIRRVAPYVDGDGHTNITDLIRFKNVERAKNPNLRKRLIEIDDHRLDVLREQGYDLTSVPSAGARIQLDLKGNISTGAESVDITEDVHPSFLDVAVRAAAAFPGLDVAGVDIIAHDFAQPAADENYIVCEINNRPGIGSHHFPVHGIPRDAAAAIVELHLAAAARRPTTAPSARIGGAAAATRRSSGSGNTMLEMELTRRGVTNSRLDSGFLIAEHNGRRLGYWGTLTHRTGRAGIRAAAQPDLSWRLLTEAGLSTPSGRAFDITEADAAREIAASLGTVTITPVASGGKGAINGIREAGDFDRAWEQTTPLASSRRVLLTQDFDGVAARFLVVGGRCVAVGMTEDGRFVDLTDQAHPSFDEIVSRATAAFPGLDVAEVIIVARDINAPAESGNHVVTAVQTRPDLLPYHFPDEGRPRDVASAIVDLHLREVNGSTD
nr:CapA family protein [Phytoactinopolyspora mesophila]